jgi:protein TonB
MANAAHHFDFRNHVLAWALALSLLLHAVLVASLHPFRFDTSRQNKMLTIELAPPQKKETPPPPPPPPEPPKQEPVKPKPQTKAEAAPPQQPVQTVVAEPPPVARMEPVRLPPPAVITAAPKTDEPPAFVAAPPEPPQPTGPTQHDIDAARNNYGSLLGREFAKHRQYPRLAQMRGWQGTVRVQLELNANGSITSSSVSESSGFEVLDNQALEMVKKASPLPPPPEVLRNRAFSIMVPVTFRLE